MPGCRRNDDSSRSPAIPATPERVQIARYVRLNSRPPRAANDNRGPIGASWRLALLACTIPALGLIAALAALI